VIAWFLPFYLKRFTPLAFIRFFLGIEAGCLCNLDTLNVNTSPSAGSLGTQPDGRERRFNRVGRASLRPVLSWKIVERQHLFPVLGQARHGFGVLGPDAGLG